MVETNTILLAPNGKQSNLTPEQYKLVRSKEFKDWFGDWEHNPSKASKIVDENGEPMVVYHGSPYKFNVFTQGERPSTTGQQGADAGYFFTSNKELANIFSDIYPHEYYDKKHEIEDKYEIQKSKELDEFFHNITETQKNELITFLVDNDLEDIANGISRGTYKIDEKLFAGIVFVLGKIRMRKSGVELIDKFLNLENDLNTKYDDLKMKELSELTDDYKQNYKGVLYSVFLNAKRIKKYNGDDIGTGDTREFTITNVFDNKYADAVVIKNADTGYGFADEYIVHSPNQIKLADGTNTTFGKKNPDIRFDDGGEIKNNENMNNTEKLIAELKKHSNVEYGKVSTSTDGKEKYRYVFYKLKYPHADNYLVRMFERASTENTGKNYNTRFVNGNYSFTYERPQFKGQKNGTMTMRYLEIMNDSNTDVRYDDGGEIQSQKSNEYEQDGGRFNYLIDKKIVGHIEYIYDLDSPISEDLYDDYESELYITIVEVDKEYRNRGIAKKLIKKVILIAKELGVEVVSLYRDSGVGCELGSDYDQYLKRIYESIGFVENNDSCGMIFTIKNKFKRGGQTKAQSNKIEKVMHEFKQGTLRSSNGKKVTNRTQALAIALSEAGVSQRYDDGGMITQQEIKAMKSYIESEDGNEFLKNSFGKVLKKFNVDLNNVDTKKYPIGKPTNPYDFYGNRYMEEENEEQGVKFLLTGEYPLVAKSIFEKDYSMWLFYNYLGRINISFDACKIWLKQAQEHFAKEMPMPLLLMHTPKAKDGRSYASYRIVSEGRKEIVESQIEMPLTFEYQGRYWYTLIGMVGNYDHQNGGWGSYYKEPKTKLLIPEFTQTSFHFNTLVHEFAHCYDFQTQTLDTIKRYEEREKRGKKETREISELERKIYGTTLDEKENEIEDIIANHFDLFVDGLIKILRAMASGKIPITQVFEQQAIDVQTALGGVYGDLLLEQRERKRQAEAMQQRADEVRDNERFSWQGKKIPDVIVEYVLDNAMQKGLKEHLGKGGAKQPYTISEIIELDNLITAFVDTKYRVFMIKFPSKAGALLESIKAMKVETNRIINNHYDNIRNKFIYGFRPTNDLEIYLIDKCRLQDFKDYKSWKECVKSNFEQYN